MPDSEDENGLWGDRDKYPKERDVSQNLLDQKLDKRPFTNNQSPNYKSTEPPFKRQRNNFDDDFNYNRRNNFDNKQNNFNSQRKESDNLNERVVINSAKPTEEASCYPTQPHMLSFKHFLQQQDDDIEMETAMVKYSEYKDSFVKKQLKAFFDVHCSEEWFREKYLPSFIENKKITVVKNITSRKEIYKYLFELNFFENIRLDINEPDRIVKLMDAFVILLEGGNENDLKILDEEAQPIGDLSAERRALHKTFSIFLRNLHPSVLRSEIEALVKPYPGFLRLSLQDPTADRKFFRRGWVTYDRTVNIKEICWNLNSIRLYECEIGAIVNRELTQRVRQFNVLGNHKPIMKHDIKLAVKLVSKFDEGHNLWPTDEDMVSKNTFGNGNPLLRITNEFLVEEETLLMDSTNRNLDSMPLDSDSSNVAIEYDDKLASLMDMMILYLRFVHSYDYYSGTEYPTEDEMPHRCGIIHARQNYKTVDRKLSLSEMDEYIKAALLKANVILNANTQLSIDEARKMGHQDSSEVVEEFIVANTKELAKDKFLCPLSGKKFKGPDFVRKHILSKHDEKIKEATDNALFFNNYIMDLKRPQLPDHPSNLIGSVKVDFVDKPVPSANRNETLNKSNNDAYTGSERSGNYRESSPTYRRDFAGRPNNFDNRSGNNGRNSFSNRGGRTGGRPMLSYRDLDEPYDD